ncbi:MAG: thioredoxin family protein [Fimbriimonadaceae bacterium]|nr:thioredoxin family protein [Fimbriimonadaceae bacterium]
MKIRPLSTLAVLLVLVGSAMSQTPSKPKSTDVLLAAAKQEARAQKKSLFVIFHASW